MIEERFGLICMIAATVTAVLWVVLLLVRRKKYKAIVAAVGRKNIIKNISAPLLQIGFNVIDLFHIKRDCRIRKSLKKWIAANHGEKFVDFYFLTILATQIASVFTLIPILLVMLAIGTDKLGIVLFVIVQSAFVLMPIYLEYEKFCEKKENLLSEFPQVVSKLTLLMCSGMPIRECWKRVSLSGNGVLYLEMQNTIEELNNGVTEIEAYKNFGKRCDVKEINKFSSMLIQNMQKGSGELTGYMRELTAEMWDVKKTEAKKKGDKAASKLVFPTSLIFAGILLLIIVPAMLQIKI